MQSRLIVASLSLLSTLLKAWRRFSIQHCLTGEEVKCFLSPSATKNVEIHYIADVFQRRRVLVVGTIHYRSLGRIRDVDADDVQFLRARTEPPNVDDILDENFTGGL